jgi:hypothetical protein
VILTTNLTPEAALLSVSGSSQLGIPVLSSSVFRCAHRGCSVPAQHLWSTALNAMVFGDGSFSQKDRTKEGKLVFAQCTNCNQETVFYNGQMVWPRTSTAPAPSADLPQELLRDYEEASAISQMSPRGAAALLRLLIQKLCAHLGTKSQSIDKAIAELVEGGQINKKIQQALDTVRVVGNQAVHPGTLDLRDDASTVLTLFNLVNYVVEKTITEPKEIDAIYNGLPQDKLKGIEDRDKKSASSQT